MATENAIRVSGLSKSYLVGHESSGRHRYVALRDVIARGVQNLARKTRDMLSGRPVVQGDDVEEFWALRDVSFEVNRGDVVGVIGRNGAGKSTLLKVLSRITEPTRGRIEITGRVASLLEVGTGFHPELTGRENIYLNGAILGMGRNEIRAKFDDIVGFAEVERFLDTPVKRYSSGMYMRLAFAVAAHLEPEILVVDEVLAVGDSEFQKKCLGKMRDVAGLGRTVLFVSHNMAAVRALCPRALLLDAGRLVAAGPSDDVIARYVAQHASQSDFSREPQRHGKTHIVRASVAEIEMNKTAGRRHLRVRLAAHASVAANVEIFAWISDNYRAPVGYAPIGSLNAQTPAEVAAGINEFDLTIDITSLALGEYSISLGVQKPFAEIYDRLDDCLTFELGSEHFSNVIHPFRQDWQVGSVLFDATIEPVRDDRLAGGAALKSVAQLR
jgi:lipopolysaccharide transport system ATP-binding protein